MQVEKDDGARASQMDMQHTQVEDANNLGVNSGCRNQELISGVMDNTSKSTNMHGDWIVVQKRGAKKGKKDISGANPVKSGDVVDKGKKLVPESTLLSSKDPPLFSGSSSSEKVALVRKKRPRKQPVLDLNTRIYSDDYYARILGTEAVRTRAAAFLSSLPRVRVGKEILILMLVEAQSLRSPLSTWKATDSLLEILWSVMDRSRAVYGSPIPAVREELWRHLQTSFSSFSAPWILAGDFNEVLLQSDVRG
ncbi:putative ribonuclease H protein, partial [Sesbania bispinosa]